MSETPSDDEINKFIEMFGTHVYRKVDMGSKFVTTASFNKQEEEDYKSQGLNLGFDASASGLWVFKASTDRTKSEENKTS